MAKKLGQQDILTLTPKTQTTSSVNPNDEEETVTELNKTPRLPRWTRQEILVLIQGKRVAESRVRRGRMGIGPGQVEPKWASVSAYCKRHGVNRGPVQCRKRWSNLSGDYKRIKEWESRETESFWVMRNDLRRERRLPGFFDKEVYDILDGAGDVPRLDLVLAAPVEALQDTAVEEEDIVFDSGRSAAAEDGLFSDFEQEDGGGGGGGGSPVTEAVKEAQPIMEAIAVVSEKQYQPTPESCQGQGTNGEKQPAINPEGGSASQEGRKRKHFTSDGDEDAISLQNQLIDVLERNGKMLATQLEAQNTNFQLDWEQRKDLAVGLITVLNKLADAIVKVADKL